MHRKGANSIMAALAAGARFDQHFQAALAYAVKRTGGCQ